MRLADLTIWTIGHSTRPIEEFVSLLEESGIQVLADVRRYPGSRAHPQYNAGSLEESLPASGIEYVPFPELGGRRSPSAESTNTVWRNAAFRAYADFMETPEFDEGLQRLIDVASARRTAIMCSEAVWWRCHRSMIADALKARGGTVLHIMGPSNVPEHPYTSAARLVDGELVYGPAEE